INHAILLRSRHLQRRMVFNQVRCVAGNHRAYFGMDGVMLISKLRKSMPHQNHALDFINAHHGSAGLFMRPGCGKTLVAIRAAQTPALVICRRDDYLTWHDELDQERRDPGYTAQFIESAKDDLPLNPKPWTIVTHDLVKNQRIFDFLTRH